MKSKKPISKKFQILCKMVMRDPLVLQVSQIVIQKDNASLATAITHLIVLQSHVHSYQTHTRTAECCVTAARQHLLSGERALAHCFLTNQSICLKVSLFLFLFTVRQILHIYYQEYSPGLFDFGKLRGHKAEFL